MHKVTHHSIALFLSTVAIAACASTASETEVSTTTQSTVGPLAGGGCSGLLNARENCPNATSCAAIDAQLLAQGCAPPPSGCPCVSTPDITFSGLLVSCATATGGTLYLCQTNPLCQQVEGAVFSTPLETCAACREQYFPLAGAAASCNAAVP